MLHPRRTVAALLAVAALAACSGAEEASVSERTGDGGAAGGSRVVPTPRPSAGTTTTAGFVAGAGQPAVPPCPPVPAAAEPASGRPSYLMDVGIRPDEGVVEGRVIVRFAPDLDTDRLVFRLPPNVPGGGAAGAVLEAGPVFLGSNAPAPVERPDPATLVVRLPGGLRAGQRIEATVPWTLTLPEGGDGPITSQDGAVRLGSFFPVLAWEPGVGWPAEAGSDAGAAASWAPSVADFSYAVNVEGGGDVLASGTLDAGRWIATAHRDLAISVGRFTVAEGVAGAPQPVQVRVGVHKGVGDDPAALLDAVVRTVTDLGARYGPYPYRSLSLAVLPGAAGGSAQPGHVVQGPGVGARSTAELLASQWFSALVANASPSGDDVDEGLARWAASRPGGAPLAPPPVGGPGAQVGAALDALAQPHLADCGLRLYLARSSFQVARPPDLASALSVVLPDAEATLRRFGVAP